METKIIKAVFGAVKSIITQPRYRYDYGQIIEVSGITLPESFEARFSNAPTGTSVRVLGSNQRVAVPDALMRTGKSVWCYITVHDAVTDGRTMYSIRIPIRDATERTDAEPTPVQQDVIEQAIAALNTAVEQTAQDVEAADASAQSASDSADRAEAARDTAEGYVGTVQGYTQQAQTSATNASSSATASANSASQAQQIKTDVEGMVDEAQSAAGASAQSALESAQSASRASVSASSASQSADTASTKASEASASAQTASAKATEASEYASTASQKASESSQSASAASGYATQAGQAKTAAETAQGLAEQAQTGAETAQGLAEDARDEAQTLVDSITGKVEQIDSNTDRIESLEDDRYKPYPTDTASGAIASFTDGAYDIPLKSLVVDINPVQDLHGQDAPYPAGGGKNKLDISAIDIKKWQLVSNVFKTRDDNYSYITITVNPDDESVTVVTSGTYMGICIDIPSGAVARVFSQDGTAANMVYLYSAYEDGATKLNDSAKSCSIPAETSGYAALLFYAAGTYTVKLQLEEGSSYTSWSPYENICPISGWTEVGVEQRGVNLLDLSILQQGEWDNTTRTYNVAFDEYLPIQGNVTYAWSSAVPSINGRYLRFYDFNKQFISSTSLYDTGTKTFTTPSNAAFYRAMWYRSNGITPSDITEDQIQVGTTATPYEPYTGRSITIDLGQTVYGGKLDVLSGVLTVDRAMVDLGTRNWMYNTTTYPDWPYFWTNFPDKTPSMWNNGIMSQYRLTATQYRRDEDMVFNCSPYNSNEAVNIRDSRYSSASAFKSAMSGVQFVYELATPITLALTPTEIKSLLGDNNLWADTGDSTVTYRADTKLYINRKIAEAVSALS